MTMTISGTAGATFPDSTTQTSAARSGGTSTSSATDITLATGSTQTQLVTMTAADKYVILPSATSLAKGEGQFEITASATSYPFAIKNGAGDILYGPIFPGITVQLTLEDNSTSAGSWTANGVIPRGGFSPTSVSTISLSSGFIPVLCLGLSSTLALIVYQSAANGLSVVAASISGTTVTFGTPVTVSASSVTQGNTTGVALSATLAVISFYNNSTATGSLAAISVSGTTCTVGALSNSPANGYILSTTPLTSTTGAFTYTWDDGIGTNGCWVRCFSVSGTTITQGTAVQLAGTGTGVGSFFARVCRTSSSSVVAAYYGDNPSTTNAVKSFTVSGTTLTGGTATNIYSQASYSNSFAYGSGISASYGTSAYSPATNTALFLSNGVSNGPVALLVTTSGTTISSIAYSQFTIGNAYSLNVTPFGTSGQALGWNKSIIYTNSAGYQGQSNTVYPNTSLSPFCWAALDAQNFLSVGLSFSSNTAYIAAQILKVI